MTEEELNCVLYQLSSNVASLAESVKAIVSHGSQAGAVCSMGLYDWFETWFETYKKPILGITTYRDNRACIENHVKPLLGDMPLYDVTGVTVQGVLNALPNRRFKETVYYLLHDCFVTAYKNGYLSRDIMATVVPYVHQREEGRALTLSEQKKFVSACEKINTGKALLYILYSGVRREEAIKLAETDIDFRKKLIHIRGTKTAGSDRYIPIFPALEKLLSPMKWTKGRYFPFSGDYLYRSLSKLDLPFHVTIKDLRTTFATRAQEMGVSDLVIAKWLGHTNVETTRQNYEKVLPEFNRKSAKKMGKMEL